ncbi:helix-turn-helix domain-containing protein [Paenibacillus larvae]|uniref:helix-turn-helix domain-containing protein n=1 Tax=Paenibacillus larvae TaxID=1464 RepID=UPI002282460F|nr:helix-turn-helix transcriptional regulator [Paenibacillus larvae]MCY9500043.1 helix-turn-helix domain-containing protein [Paenibacillus larvae]
MDISQKIRDLMNKKQITTYKLSKEAKVPYTTLTKILNGTTKNPQIDSLKLIADYFGKPLDYFLTEDKKKEINIPSWATAKDKRDFKKMLEEEAEVMFDGVPIDEEDREKIKRVMEAIFWDAKKKNKRKPIKED